MPVNFEGYVPLTMQAASARTRLPPEQRRAQLLRCAIAAFAEHGIARATHAHIAERAGVSVPAVHSYFRTREDLVAETLGEVETYLMAIVDDVEIKKMTARDALSRMVLDFDKAAQEFPEVIKVWLDWSTGFRADVWPRYLTMQDRLLETVRRVLVRGQRAGELSPSIDALSAARLYVGGGHTVALLRFAGGAPADIDRLINHLIRSIIGIRFEPDLV